MRNNQRILGHSEVPSTVQRQSPLRVWRQSRQKPETYVHVDRNTRKNTKQTNFTSLMPGPLVNGKKLPTTTGDMHPRPPPSGYTPASPPSLLSRSHCRTLHDVESFSKLLIKSRWLQSWYWSCIYSLQLSLVFLHPKYHPVKTLSMCICVYTSTYYDEQQITGIYYALNILLK